MQDFVIVGGGVVGTFIAFELSKYNKTITLIEKEKDLATVQTRHNSALVHSPVMVPPNKGKLKAKLALEGNRAYQTLVETLNIPHLKNGAYVLAVNDDEMERLHTLQEAAIERNLNAERIGPDALRQKEKNISPDVRGGLFLKDAMTADTYALCQTLEQITLSNGVTFKKATRIRDIRVTEEGFTLSSDTDETFRAKHVINAAGVQAETIARMVEKTPRYTMKPHRGEYMVLPESQRHFVNATLFPVPQHDTKGILVIPQPDGTIRLGPTSTYQTSLDDASVTSEGLDAIRSAVDTLVSNVPYETVETTYAGIRSTIDQDDFYIGRSHEHPGFIHVAGIDSPGVTSAPAIARYVREEILKLK